MPVYLETFRSKKLNLRIGVWYTLKFTCRNISQTNSTSDLFHGIHLRASFIIIKACWPYMKAQKYGRYVVVHLIHLSIYILKYCLHCFNFWIVWSSSTSAIHIWLVKFWSQNCWDTIYLTAKMGLYGLSMSLAASGKEHNILCNAIAPHAASRLAVGILPDGKKPISTESDIHKYFPLFRTVRSVQAGISCTNGCGSMPWK